MHANGKRWRLVGTLMIAAILAAESGAYAQATDSVTGYARAQALYHAHNYRDAITALDAYILANPQDAKALVLRGDAKASLDDNLGALKDYNAAITAAPQYQYAYETRCETRLDMDDRAGALADCDMAVKLDPNDSRAYEDRADIQFDRDAYDLALIDYDKAVSLGESSAYVFAARCDTERLVNKLDLARVDCEKSLTLDPNNRRGFWASGRLAILDQRYSDGIAMLTSYIAIRPDNSNSAFYWRGLANNRLKNFAAALDDLRIYIQNVSDDGVPTRNARWRSMEQATGELRWPTSQRRRSTISRMEMCLRLPALAK